MSVYASSGVTHGGEAELHSLVFASKSNGGRLNPVWSFFFPLQSLVSLHFLKNNNKKKSVFFLSFLFKCSVYLLLSTVMGGDLPSARSLVLGPTPAPRWEDPPPGRARRWAEAGCV